MLTMSANGKGKAHKEKSLLTWQNIKVTVVTKHYYCDLRKTCHKALSVYVYKNKRRYLFVPAQKKVILMKRFSSLACFFHLVERKRRRTKANTRWWPISNNMFSGNKTKYIKSLKHSHLMSTVNKSLLV